MWSVKGVSMWLAWGGWGGGGGGGYPIYSLYRDILPVRVSFLRFLCLRGIQFHTFGSSPQIFSSLTALNTQRSCQKRCMVISLNYLQYSNAPINANPEGGAGDRPGFDSTNNPVCWADYESQPEGLDICLWPESTWVQSSDTVTKYPCFRFGHHAFTKVCRFEFSSTFICHVKIKGHLVYKCIFTPCP